MVDPVLLQSLSTDQGVCLNDFDTLFIARFNKFRIRRVEIGPLKISRQNDCNKRETYQCAVLVFFILT